jgi:hypothetical protein
VTTGWRNSGCREIMALVAVAARENMRGEETIRTEWVKRNRLIEGFLPMYFPPESLHYSLRLTPPPPPVHPLLPSSRSRTIGDASHTQRPIKRKGLWPEFSGSAAVSNENRRAAAGAREFFFFGVNSDQHEGCLDFVG